MLLHSKRFFIFLQYVMKQLCTPCTIKVNSATSDAELKNAKI